MEIKYMNRSSALGNRIYVEPSNFELKMDLKRIKTFGVKEIFYLHPAKRFVTFVLNNNSKLTINGRTCVEKVLRILSWSK